MGCNMGCNVGSVTGQEKQCCPTTDHLNYSSKLIFVYPQFNVPHLMLTISCQPLLKYWVVVFCCFFSQFIAIFGISHSPNTF